MKLTKSTMSSKRLKARKVKSKPGKVVERITLTPSELVAILGVSRSSIYALLHSRRIGSVKIGRRFICPRAALDRFLASAD